MTSLGLALNVNHNIKKKKVKVLEGEDEEMENEEEAVEDDKVVVNRAVVEEYERQAREVKKCERHISPDEAKFLMTLMHTHHSDYDNMCKDKRNTYQHTASKLKFKCQALLTSPLYDRYKELYPHLCHEETMET